MKSPSDISDNVFKVDKQQLISPFQYSMHDSLSLHSMRTVATECILIKEEDKGVNQVSFSKTLNYFQLSEDDKIFNARLILISFDLESVNLS